MTNKTYDAFGVYGYGQIVTDRNRNSKLKRARLDNMHRIKAANLRKAFIKAKREKSEAVTNRNNK
jgi:hypothetical protein|tara:strand:- start:771 stop:965 length:195 start_codon:yes stop_codon:yes gene_type:complete